MYIPVKKIIWVLGSNHPNAQRSILWLSPFPNFSNCDVLIVNLQSLDKLQYSERYNDLIGDARRYIFDMLMTQEKEVIVISPSDEVLLRWLPIYPTIREIAPAKIRQLTLEPPISDYLNTVEECSFYIHNFDRSYVDKMTNPMYETSQNYFFTKDARADYISEIVIERRIENVAKQIIGGYVRFRIYYGRVRRGADFFFKGHFLSGRIIFLPSPTKVTVEQAIDIMVNILAGAELIESPPTWENKIDLPGLKDIEVQILQKEKEKEVLTRDIAELCGKKDNLIKLRRLLWTKGTPLENIVKDAFHLLGFTEIRKIREENLEDWVIDFKHVKEYQHGVFEIKGADKRTSLADLTQCNKWVEDYMLDKKKAKGIFVPNQYRLSNISTRKKEREHFEENEKEYSRTRDICILPSHEIFFAVNEKMKNNPKITRKFIEEKIAASKGIGKLSETE